MFFSNYSRRRSLLLPSSRAGKKFFIDSMCAGSLLDPLRKAEREKVQAIQEAAIKYYEPFTDPVSRAEEIYYRLSLGQNRTILDQRWMPGIEDALRNAIDEVPPESQAYLAAKLNVELESH